MIHKMLLSCIRRGFLFSQPFSATILEVRRSSPKAFLSFRQNSRKRAYLSFRTKVFAIALAFTSAKLGDRIPDHAGPRRLRGRHRRRQSDDPERERDGSKNIFCIFFIISIDGKIIQTDFYIPCMGSRSPRTDSFSPRHSRAGLRFC